MLTLTLRHARLNPLLSLDCGKVLIAPLNQGCHVFHDWLGVLLDDRIFVDLLHDQLILLFLSQITITQLVNDILPFKFASLILIV